MSKSFENQVVLITGATAGIGYATALAFAREGAKLIVSGRSVVAGKKLESELLALGAEAQFVQADISAEDQVAQLVDNCVQRFGRIDIAVNSAGLEGTRGSIMEQTVETYTAAFNANAEPILALLSSLSERGGVPAHRLSYWNDIEYNPGRVKASRKSTSTWALTRCAAIWAPITPAPRTAALLSSSRCQTR